MPINFLNAAPRSQPLTQNRANLHHPFSGTPNWTKTTGTVNGSTPNNPQPAVQDLTGINVKRYLDNFKGIIQINHD